MKLTCPYCGNKFAIAEATRAETLVNLTQALAGFGKWCPLIWEYTGAFAESMRKVCDLEKHGFGNHNYLKRVMAGDAERISAEGLTAADEKKREEDRSQRSEVRDQEEEPRMTPEAQKAFKKKLGVRKFSDLIGKKQRSEVGGQKTMEEGRGKMDEKKRPSSERSDLPSSIGETGGQRSEKDKKSD